MHHKIVLVRNKNYHQSWSILNTYGQDTCELCKTLAITETIYKIIAFF